jgi:DMSO/TMAO reductase YedYZ molybdopterin-dependent catalytic subunit
MTHDPDDRDALMQEATRVRWRWRGAGLLAGCLAFSFLWAASRIEPAIRFPPLSVGERIVRVVPGDLATFFIDTLGRNAVRLLTLAAVLGSLALLALLPEASAARGRPRPLVAGAVVALLAAGSVAVDPLPPAPFGAIFGSIAAGILYAVSLGWLTDPPSPGATDEARVSRRRALASIAAAAAGFAVGGTVLGRVAHRLAGPDTNVQLFATDEPAVVPTRPSFPDVPGLSQEITSPGDHYVVDIDLLDPVVEADDWRLRVRGLVETPLELSFTEIQRSFDLVEECSVLTCISNPVGGDLVGSSPWTGVRLGDILARAGLRADAVDVVFRCADGYTDSIPVEAALDPGVILAIAHGGEPLTQEHGFPCRVRIPAVYGMKNAKWLEEIEVVGFDYRGYWEQRGWSDVAIVRTQSRIDVVGPDPRSGQPAWIAGVAWAGDRSVSKVEVSIDEGRTWRATELHQPVSRLAWTQWAFAWTPDSPGQYRIRCRATDGEGSTQEATEQSPHPSGATGHHEVEMEVV